MNTSKKFKSLLFIGLLAAFSASAQVTIVTDTNGVTTLTTNTASPASLWTDLGTVLGDVGLSSNPTNYAAGVFAGMNVAGNNQYSIGAYIIENVNNYVGIMAGVDQLFGGGKLDSENIVSGGLTLKAPTHPLQFLTSATNSWAYNFALTPYAMVLVATPIGGTGNAGGGLGGLVRAGANFDIVSIGKWKIGAGADYGNRTGSGAYNGNWVDLTVNARCGF